MTTKHTPGPWRIDEYRNFVTPDGPLYLGGVTTPLTLGEDMRKGWENAHRIVACVNACEGISTQNLEDNVPFLELARRYNAVLRERDVLRTVLADLLNDLEERASALADENTALRAKIERMEKQEPVATIHINSITGNPSVDFIPGHRYLHHNSSLYALPGAKGEEK